MERFRLWLALTIVCVLVLVLIYFYAERIYGKMRDNVRSKLKENVVNRLLSTLSIRKYVLLKGVRIPTTDGNILVEHILVSIYGIFVIESIDWGGYITGEQDAEEWLHCDSAGVEFKRSNPIFKNQESTKALQNLLGLGYDDFISVLAFVGSVELDVEIDMKVANINNFTKVIKSYHNKRFTRKQMLFLASEIRVFNLAIG